MNDAWRNNESLTRFPAKDRGWLDKMMRKRDASAGCGKGHLRPAFTEIETGSTQRCRLGTTKCEGLTRRR